MNTEINTGDTAWVLMSTALVLLMTPALAFFYGGMVRRKNILSTLTLSIVMMGVISLQWVLFGYSLAFDKSIGGISAGWVSSDFRVWVRRRTPTMRRRFRIFHLRRIR